VTTIAEIRQKYPQYEDLSDEQLAQSLHKKHYSDMDYADFSKRVGLAAPEQKAKPRLHAPGPIGLAVDLGANMARNTLATVGQGYAGIESLFNPRANTGVEAMEGLKGEPLTAEGQFFSKIQGYPFEKLAQFADYAGGATAEKTGLPSLGAGVNTAIQSLPAIVGGRGAIGPVRNLGAAKGAKPAAPAAGRQAGLGGVPPTIEELAAQSKAAYKRASDSGVTIVPNSFNTLKVRVNANLKKEGIDPTLHPGTTAALKRINETNGAVTLDQLETLRKIANDARGGINKADGRLAGKIVDELDDYTTNIGQKDVISGSPEGFAALKEARGLYARKSKAEEIARLVKRAEDSAPNFSASGYENALRIQFKQLAMNDKKMRRFNAEEQAVIRKVARGGPMENGLRMLGKLAPTGVVSGIFGIMASSLPGGVALPAAGIAGRYAATQMTKANALKAEQLMRRGPAPKPKRRNALEELTETTP
jgi:hypothetical protein